MRLSMRHTAITWLALIALISQLLLSLGHVHGAGSRVSLRTAVQGIQLSQEHAPRAPALPNPHDESCLVCWAASISGSGLIPLSPAVFGPVDLVLRHRPDRAAPWRLIQRAAQFHARAPPSPTLS